MNFITTTKLSNAQKEAIHNIWNTEYPATLQHTALNDFDNYLNKLTNHKHLLATDGDGMVKGWLFSFIREDETWFSLLIDHSEQGQGLGSQLLNLAKDACTELNGWVIDHNNAVKSDGTLYKSPMDFYLKHNFVVLHDIRLEIEVMSAVKIKWINENINNRR